MNRNYLFSLMMVVVLIGSSCNTSKTVQGAAVGGAAGSILGTLLAKKGKKARGVLIGGVIGGTVGAVVGKYMDKQAKKMEEELENAEVERVGEGILITFDSGLMFDYNSYGLKTATKTNLDDLAGVLKEYPDTEILIQGHTDSKGSEEYNLELSEKRAKSVYNHLLRKGVSSSRLVTMGLGESEPIATNETDEGRQQNRRVEVAVVANEKLRQDAAEGKVKI